MTTQISLASAGESAVGCWAMATDGERAENWKYIAIMLMVVLGAVILSARGCLGEGTYYPDDVPRTRFD
jgi:hypothetical protein